MNSNSAYTLDQIPFYSQLQDSKTILIAGCGGGYDVYSGLPLLYNLRKLGYQCHLWNLTFTAPELLEQASQPVVPGVLWRVRAGDKSGAGEYFPELYLSQYLEQSGFEGESIVYTASRTGVVPLKSAMQSLINQLGIDTVILVDGGTDSLMQGNEEGLGTPHEDMLSIKTLYDCDVQKKLLVCLGFGIDAFHHVCHVHFLENTAQIIREGGYLGVFALMHEMEECKHFARAVEFAAARMEPSIVQSSVMHACQGYFGDHHFTDRTKGSKLFINPLMGLYWCYDLASVARNVAYLPMLEDTQSFQQIDDRIRAYRSTLKPKDMRKPEVFPH